MIGSRLPETQLDNNKVQDAITSNWKDNKQIEGSKIFQQT